MQAGVIQKIHLTVVKKTIIIRSNKKLFAAALPPLLYTRAIFYLLPLAYKSTTICPALPPPCLCWVYL